MHQSKFIGISGGSASGKTLVAEEIKESLEKKGKKVLIVSLDCFYKNLSDKNLKLVEQDDYNFDSPDALDKKLMISTLTNLKNGVDLLEGLPIYSFVHHKRLIDDSNIVPVITKNYDIFIVEGIFALYFEELKHLYDLKIFVDVDGEERLSRRIIRDTLSRGRTIKSVTDQYNKFVKPSYNQFVKPSKKEADIIIPHGAFNQVSTNLIVNYFN